MSNPPEKPELRILHLEDNLRDHQLTLEWLKRAGFRCQILHVRSETEFEEQLKGQKFDLILCDFTLPGYSGWEALARVRQTNPDLPFIFLSGSLGEETAVETLKHGATDYILKGSLDRLTTAIERAIRNAEERSQARRAERIIREQQNEMLRMQRVEALGALASGIAHDLNNILAPILMGSELLREKSADPETKDWINTIEASARRGADLVKQILAFVRGIESEARLVKPQDWIAEVQQLLAETLPRSIEIKVHVPTGLWMIQGQPTQLHQVALNLAINARDAMPQGGTLTISLENAHLSPESIFPEESASPGPYVMLRVSDTGVGMEGEVLQRIFDPFFTTKPLKQGSGLGLSIVSGIVKSHHGILRVKSAPGQGTEFRLYFPAVTREPPAPAQAESSPLLRSRGEFILLVDDEAACRLIAKAILENYGYEVITAADGAEGVAMFAQYSTRIDLVLTDTMMPHMDGSAMIAGIRRIRPDIKVIVLSGLAEPPIQGQCYPGPSVEFLQKPFSAEQLLSTVHQVCSQIERPRPNPES